MHDQGNRTPADDPESLDLESAEEAILTMLVDDESQRPWSIEEVARELDRPESATDALASLHGAGLIHRLEGGFVFATRPAVRAAQLG